MTKQTSGGAGEGGPGPEGASSIGRYLASQRRLRGITLDELAERTRIPRRNLERLESGAFDAQPDGFVRGFVRTVAEALGLDPRDAVMRLVEEPAAAGDEALRVRRRRAAAVVALLALVAVAIGLTGASVAIRWLAKSEADPSEAWTYRRDAVRALAEQEARENRPLARDEPLPEAETEPWRPSTPTP